MADVFNFLQCEIATTISESVVWQAQDNIQPKLLICLKLEL